MGDTDTLSNNNNLNNLPEDLIDRHRQEKKELNAKITKLRFSVPKNDKKRKKEINQQIDDLETEMKTKQDLEIKKWLESQQQQLNESNKSPSSPCSSSNSNNNLVNNNNNKSDNNTTTNVNNNNNGDDDDELESSNENNDFPNKLSTNFNYKQTQKITKSQRRRENKERKDKERQERIRSGQLDDLDNTRSIEMKKIESLLEARNLSLCEIPSDGDCLYKAIEHQLRLTRNLDNTVDELRYQASEYIRGNKSDFLPFLLNEDNNVVTDKEFEIYCDKIANTKTWGGHLELKALSQLLKVPIEIIQAEGTPVQIGFNEFGSNNALILCYFRHAYRLGEHYNSVMPNGDEVADEEEWHNTE